MVPDSVAVVVCRSSAGGRVLVRKRQISLCCLLLDVLLIAADCWLIISSSDFFCFGTLLLSSFWTYKPWSQESFFSSPLGYCLHFFRRIGFSTHWSSIFHQVLLTHALALSASQLVHKTTNYTSTHSGGFELTKPTCTRLKDIIWYATGAVSDIEPVAPVV